MAKFIPLYRRHFFGSIYDTTSDSLRHIPLPRWSSITPSRIYDV
nr:MAG TPA: hypothetical protein [Caudoviricetes sp.]